MDLDFHKLYNDYSTAGLLAITMRPERYQPAAVAAAEEILKERNVTQADIAEAEQQCREEEPEMQHKTEAAITLKRIEMPGVVNAVLAIVILQYLYLLYIDIRAINNVLSCVDCPFRLVSLLSYIDLVYLPFLFLMYHMRMRWGWILLYGSKVFTIIPAFSYYFSYYVVVHGLLPTPSFLISIFLNVLVIVLMWRQDVTSTFRITKRIKIFTLAGTAGLLLLTWLSLAGS